MPSPNGYHRDTQTPQRVRKYEVFPGRNRFCCSGRIITSTQLGIFYLTLSLIVGTSICFFALDAWYLWVELKLYPLPIIAGLLVIFVVSVLCRTALSDPGIIPRATPAEAAALEKIIEEENSSNASTNGLPHRPPPRIREVTVNGMPFKLKYCYTCKIFRPPRASHCSVCDNCVDRFDHHCPWVGNCVGRRNYKYFFLFLTSLTVYCVYLMALSITCIVFRTQRLGSFVAAMQNGPLSPVVTLIAFFSIWSVAGLGGFHTYLTALGITTNEDIKGTFKKSRGGNPFSAGNCCANCMTIVCGPVPPSVLDSRGWVTNDDVEPPQTNQPNRRFGGYGTKALPLGSTSVVTAQDQTYSTTQPARASRSEASLNIKTGGSTSFTTTVSNQEVNGQHPVELQPLADSKMSQKAASGHQYDGTTAGYPRKLPPLENRSATQIDLESGSGTHTGLHQPHNV